MKKLFIILSILLISTASYAVSQNISIKEELKKSTIKEEGRTVFTDENLISELRDIADKWVQLMDEGRFAEAWEQTTVEHKIWRDGRSTKNSFIMANEEMTRKFYGKVIARKFNNVTYIEDDTDNMFYMLSLNYKTIFEWPDTETVWDEDVCFKIDEDGQWRVCGWGGSYSMSGEQAMKGLWKRN